MVQSQRTKRLQKTTIAVWRNGKEGKLLYSPKLVHVLILTKFKKNVAVDFVIKEVLILVNMLMFENSMYLNLGL